MKLLEKIKDFENVEDLISEIKSDKITNNILSRRFPVRLPCGFLRSPRVG